ncbi:microfibril-associated glycoprotein 4-like isoform X2 [Watersipora subatra]|uniref:microfibril-associated glycoprotein 4-like isoform X2 n=1 Tax=Watersipora subatra TaxID=2589382 RepID=UPI00355C2001
MSFVNNRLIKRLQDTKTLNDSGECQWQTRTNMSNNKFDDNCMKRKILLTSLAGSINIMPPDAGNTQKYTVTRNVVNVVGKNNISAYDNKESFSLSHCVQQCTSESTCFSALRDEVSGECLLFNSALDVATIESTSTKVYMEKTASYIPVEACCLVPESYSCTNFPLTVYQDCQDAFDNGERNSGAIYFLCPNSAWRVIKAVCEFDHASGWTIIQRRIDGSVDFYRGWREYVHGFGYLKSEYWIGLDSIYHLTQRNQKLSVYIQAHDGESRTANYSEFYIDDAEEEYKLHVAGYTGNAGDSLIVPHNGKKFSTFDNDNDENDSEGAWWYKNCHFSNPNGNWVDGGIAEHGTGIVWAKWKGFGYSFKVITLKLGH